MKYVIGDIHGCYSHLMRLLEKIDYSKESDQLFFTGDLVNGGKEPVQVLEFIKNLGKKATVVLGNHDLTLLGAAYKVLSVPADREYGIEEVLNSPKLDDIVEWLATCPLAYVDAKDNILLVHAGVVPNWDLKTTVDLAQAASDKISGPQRLEFLKNMYGNQPDTWSPQLNGWDRVRYTVNVLTRLRFCTQAGKLDLASKGNIDQAPQGFKPWFEFDNSIFSTHKVLFGHWAAIRGNCNVPNVHALDTGCMWGGSLTALCIDNMQRYCVSCEDKN